MAKLRDEQIPWMPSWRFVAALLAGLLVVLDASALPAKLGDLDEDGVATIHDVVAILNHIHGRTPLAPERVSFADLNRDGLVNVSDANQVADAVVAALALADIDFSPTVAPTIPYTSLDRFTFSGSNFPMTLVRVSSAFGSVDVQSDSGGAFSIELPLGDDREHDFYLSGYDASGSRLAPVPLSILRDSEPPSIEIVYPRNGSTTIQSEIVIGGRLSDSLNGRRGMAVTVDGVAADVFSGDGENGTFVSDTVALSLGSNVIQVRAVDAAGNTSTQNLSVVRLAQESFFLEKAQGDRLVATVGTLLPNNVAVRVLGPGRTPIIGKPVVFEVIDGLGVIQSLRGGLESSKLSVLTDAGGIASTRWRMSTVAGKANHLLRATSRDIQGELIFVASAIPNAVVRLNEVGGDGQVAPAGSIASRSLRVWVNDGGNALSGKPVLFQVTDGGGKVNAQNSVTVTSGAAGFAEVQFTMGETLGRQRVAVSVVGESGANLVFDLQAVAKASAVSTSVTGLVLTPFLSPIAGARVELMIEGTRYGPVNSNGAGGFRLDGVAIGAAELQFWMPNGSTSQTSQSTPLSVRRLFLEPRAINSLRQPMILPVTLNRETISFDGSTEVALSLDGNANFVMIIPAGSIRTAEGAVPSAALPIHLSLKQIPTGNLPFRPAHGESPRIAWLLEPSDLVFAVPPRLTIPDLAGLEGDSSIGLFGVDQRIQQFDRFVSLGASGVPASYQNQAGRGTVPAGFAFVNAGYHGGRATVTSGQASPPAPVE